MVKKEPRVLLKETEFTLLLLGVQFIYITNFRRLEILELTSLGLPDRINRGAKIPGTESLEGKSEHKNRKRRKPEEDHPSFPSLCFLVC